MKNQISLFTIVGMIATLTLSACGASVKGSSSGGLNSPDPVANNSNNAQGACTDFSGSYSATGIASLTLKQNGCASVDYAEACTGDANFCSMFGIQNVSFTLPLNGTTNGNGFSGTISGGTLTIVQTTNGVTQTQAIQVSAHPCDPSNPTAGLEVQVTSAQSEDGGTVSSTTCQPWGKN
jgi:hypothetical protein